MSQDTNKLTDGLVDEISQAEETVSEAVDTAEAVADDAEKALKETSEEAAETVADIEDSAAEALSGAAAEADEEDDPFTAAKKSAFAAAKKNPAKVKTKKRRAKNLEKGNAIAGFLFILPFVIGFLLFLCYPLGMSMYMTLNKVSATAGEGLKFSWLGFWNKSSNFYWIFRIDKDYIEALLGELKRMLLFVPGILVFSFFMASLLNQEFRGRTVVRAIYFLPVILSAGVFLGVESNNQLLASVSDAMKEENSAAVITQTLENILLSGETGNTFFQYVIDIVGQVYDIAMSSGIQIIIFLSGLQTIPPSMYEAAKMEGCTGWESFWKITFPLISSMILVNVVYTMIDFFTRTDSQLMTVIDNTLLIRFEYGKVAAMSWVYFLIIAAFLGLVFLIFSRRVYYYD
ncbi:MAG: ABC transporter permease subunit [Lachnospiraceae bacterium]|nr:ABC transporter permease subunit [Lachnospiraceae bacterium]